MSDTQQSMKILIIRMQSAGEVLSIGLPTLRYFKIHFPDAEIEMLTYDKGEQLIKLAEPDIKVHALGKEQWPDNILLAMETFLGLAETIIGESYTRIINLDTNFMPCFLARFLKDAGEAVEGNLMGISVQSLIDQFQAQTLRPQYVNDPGEYLQSSWFSMVRWHTPWWEGEFLPDMGYPEFYLKSCCGFESIEMNMTVPINSDTKFKKLHKKQKIIALNLPESSDSDRFPARQALSRQLEKAGYHVWYCGQANATVQSELARLKESDLLVSVPSDYQWYATAVSCVTLLLCEQVDPRTLMPDYAAEPEAEPITSEDMLENIDTILSEADPSS